MNDENELRSEDALQTVKYLGKAPSSYAQGVDHLIEPIHSIWNQSKKGRRFHRCAISIHSFGLCVYEEIADGTYRSVWSHAIQEVSYCVAEPHRHRRSFAWIARSSNSDQLECHLVLCKTRRLAQALADYLAKIFYETYRTRQQGPLDFSPPVSVDCFVCETMARNSIKSTEGKVEPADIYERVSLHLPVVNRIYLDNFDSTSITSYSHQSIDFDETLIDEESIRPIEN